MTVCDHVRIVFSVHTNNQTPAELGEVEGEFFYYEVISRWWSSGEKKGVLQIICLSSYTYLTWLGKGREKEKYRTACSVLLFCIGLDYVKVAAVLGRWMRSGLALDLDMKKPSSSCWLDHDYMILLWRRCTLHRFATTTTASGQGATKRSDSDRIIMIMISHNVSFQ